MSNSIQNEKKPSNRLMEFISKIDLVIILFFFSSLGLRWLIPGNIILGSMKDDALGVVLAHNLSGGHWLGEWTPDTLVKPPAYSFFLVLVKVIPLDPTFILHTLYLLISLLLVKSISMFFIQGFAKSYLFQRASFLLLAFNPAIFGSEFSRIYRNSLSSLAVFLFFVLVLRLILHLTNLFNATEYSWRHFKSKSGWKISISLGLTYSTLILSRTESYFVLITSLPLIFGVWFFSLRGNHFRWLSLKKYSSGLVLLKISMLSVFFAVMPVLAISYTNNYVYGVWENENYYSGNFARAANLWSSVQNGKSSEPFISVSKDQRAAVYPISKAALTLKSVLDGPPNTGWKATNCIYTNVCDESGSWFPWELRDAAVTKNAISNEVEFQKFFGTLSDEIYHACHAKKLICGNPGMSPGMKPISEYPIRQLLDQSAKAFGSLLSFNQAMNITRLSDGVPDAALLEIWRSTVHIKYVPETASNSSWMRMNNTIETMRKIYQSFLPFLLFFIALSFLSKKKQTNRLLSWYLLATLATVILYCGVLGVFATSLGFEDNFVLYGLTIQPLFLLSIVVALANTVDTIEKMIPDLLDFKDSRVFK